MRPWRDIISSNAWQEVMRKHDSTAHLSVGKRLELIVNKDVTTPARLRVQIGQKIDAYHKISKTNKVLLVPRRSELLIIAGMAETYLQKFNVDMDKAKQRARCGEQQFRDGYKPTGIDKWDKSIYTGQYEGGAPWNELLDRNMLTLARRARRKAAYLQMLGKCYDNPVLSDPAALLAYLKKPQEVSSDGAIGLYPGVRMEALDPMHRPYEFKMRNGQVEINDGLEPVNITYLFKQWIDTVNQHHAPFFLWLEASPICLDDSKENIAATRSVNYIRADKGQGVPGFDKLFVVSISPVGMSQAPLGQLGASSTRCDTSTFSATDKKGGPGCAAYVHTDDGALFIAEHREGYFHHSSFLSGGAVQCAGMIRIEQGRVKFVSNNSGHYKPPKERLLKFVRELWRCNLVDEDATRVICHGGRDFDGTVQQFFDNFATLCRRGAGGGIGMEAAARIWLS